MSDTDRVLLQSAGAQRWRTAAFVAAVAGVFASLYLLGRSNYLLFHVGIELFTVVVAFGIFIVAWNTRKWVSNDYLLLLGIAYLFVAIVDLAHMLTYKGMGVFPAFGSNQPTQFWILARYIEAFSLLVAPLFLTRHLRLFPVVAAYVLMSGFGLLSIGWLGIFPDCFVEGQGLTAFKVASEYTISAVLFMALWLLYGRRTQFEPRVFRMLVVAIVTTVAAEMSFTLYTDVYGVANLVGHLLKAVSFYLVYKAVVVTSLATPYELLFRDLAQSRDQVLHERDLSQSYLEIAGTILLVLDSSGRVQLVNRRGAEVLGYEREELIGRDWFADFLLPYERAGVRAAYDSLMSGNIELAEYVENRVVTRDGSERLIAWHNSVLRDSQGVITGTLGSGQDITEQRGAEEMLRQSEERFRALFDRAPEAYYLSDLEGRFVDANAAAERLVGYRKDELLGKTFFESRLLSEEMAAQAAWLVALSAKGESTGPDELTLIRQNGEQVVIEIRTELIESGGRPLVLGIAHDVTERKRAEEQVRLQRDRFMSLFSNTVDAIALLQSDYRIVDVNSAFCELFGYSREEVLNQDIDTLIVPEDRTKESLDLSELSESGRTAREVDTVRRRRDGSLVAVAVTGSPIVSGGRTVGVFAIYRNITERKSAATSMKVASERLERAMAASNLAWWQMTLPFGEVVFDERKATMLGYPTAAFSHYEDFTKLLHPDDHDTAMQAMREHIEGRVARYEVEYRIRTASGECRWFRDVGEVTERDSDGKPSVVTGIVVDITGLKRAEEHLAESNRELRELAARLDTAREEERAAVAWELHDEVAQALSVIKLDITTCALGLPVETESQIRPSMSRIVGLLDTTIERLRRLYTDLVPVMLEDLGIAATIEWHAGEFRREKGIDCRLGTVEDIKLPHERVALSLFRSLQEALEWASAQVGVTRVTVNLKSRDGHAALSVACHTSDRLTLPAEKEDSWGFVGIRERVRVLGGSLSVQSVSAHDAVLIVTVPLGTTADAHERDEVQ
ncbi:MAG: PAS domain S-box protein [Dehalococcoidia bacterium]|nr:PAS domain S-box protein [Dehalococcoidia bacterium]